MLAMNFVKEARAMLRRFLILFVAVVLFAASGTIGARFQRFPLVFALGRAEPTQRPLYLSAHHPQQETGSITGRVVDAEGKPIYGALVQALPQKGNTGALPRGRTNRRGIFTINKVEVGTYYLSASKKEAGYGDFWNRFYSAGFVEDLEVTVYAGQTVSCGDIRLGPKAGKLVGTLRDATTKKGIVATTSPGQTRHVILCRRNDPKNCFDASPNRNGDFEVLVPPVPFTIEATAPGYEKKDLGPLRLKQGEIRRFDILLTTIE